MIKTIVLVAHLFDSSPSFQAIVEPAPTVASSTVTARRLDGVTVESLDGNVFHLAGPAGAERVLLDDGSILAVDPDGRVWKL